MRCYLRSCSLRSFSTSDCYRLVFTHFSYFLPSTLRDFPPIYLWNLHHAACNNSYISRSLKGLMPRGVLIPIIFVQCHIVNRPQVVHRIRNLCRAPFSSRFGALRGNYVVASGLVHAWAPGTKCFCALDSSVSETSNGRTSGPRKPINPL